MAFRHAHCSDAQFVDGEFVSEGAIECQFFGGDFFREAGDGRPEVFEGVDEEGDDAGVADAVRPALVVVADECCVHRVDFFGDEAVAGAQ